MQYSSVMVHVSPSEVALNRIALAAELAERFAAVLIGIAARPVNIQVFNEYGGLEDRVIKHELNIAVAQITDAERLFKRAAMGRNCLEWRSKLGRPTPFIVEQARAADLIVIANDGGEAMRHGEFGIDPGELLVQAGRPLLVVPAKATELSVNRALIAWKNTREARRSLRDSLPLLKEAEVSVIAVAEADDDPGLTDVCAYLGRHGIVAQAILREGDDADAFDQILRAARERDVDLIIAGGYGHRRTTEWLFGGVTRSLLGQWSGSCLLAH
ncbi:MAG: universal stress protein [Hyphomicrobiales bacterium]|nr:universal stress protein [Hyphomicrobiales bacterium]